MAIRYGVNPHLGRGRLAHIVKGGNVTFCGVHVVDILAERPPNSTPCATCRRNFSARDRHCLTVGPRLGNLKKGFWIYEKQPEQLKLELSL